MSSTLPEDWLHRELFACITENKQTLFREKSQLRTRYIRWAAEDVEHEQNASALLRTADSLGYDEVHVFEAKYKFQVQPNIAKRADKWVDTYLHNRDKDLSNKLQDFKNQGLKIVATTPHQGAYSPETLPLEEPMVIFLGSERDGLSQEIIEKSDYKLSIPMLGFSESMNVSVSAGILMYTLRKRMENELTPAQWLHSASHRMHRERVWAQKTVPHADEMVARWEQDWKK